jgi:hypothetical protein
VVLRNHESAWRFDWHVGPGEVANRFARTHWGFQPRDVVTPWARAQKLPIERDPGGVAGLRDARRLTAQLKATHPDAAGSLLEGLEEMFTVARLGSPERYCPAPGLPLSHSGRRTWA